MGVLRYVFSSMCTGIIAEKKNMGRLIKEENETRYSSLPVIQEN